MLAAAFALLVVVVARADRIYIFEGGATASVETPCGVADQTLPAAFEPAATVTATRSCPTASAAANLSIESFDPSRSLVVNGAYHATDAATGTQSTLGRARTFLGISPQLTDPNGSTVTIRLRWTGAVTGGDANDRPALLNLQVIEFCPPLSGQYSVCNSTSTNLDPSGQLERTIAFPAGGAMNIVLTADAQYFTLPGVPLGVQGAFRIEVNVVSSFDPDKNNGPCPLNCASHAGNPINIATGNKYHEESDFVGGAATELAFARHYNSLGTVPGSMGALWRTTFDRALLTVDANRVRLVRPQGRVETFVRSGDVWSSDPDVTTRLRRTAGGGWEAVTELDETETYTSTGRLLSIRRRGGFTSSLSYDASGRLAEVSGPFGHHLEFVWDASGRVSAFTAPDGAAYGYAYDQRGNLTTVTYPDGTSKRYLYENATYPRALTAIIDQLGNRFTTYVYDTSGRATTSERAGGVARTFVRYDGTGQTNVTDARGSSRVQGFVSQFGLLKTAAIGGTPCLECGASGFDYDVNGYISLMRDFNGVTTRFQRDTRGLELQRTEAAGTPRQRLVTTEWHPVFRVPTRIAEPGRTTTFEYDVNGNLLRHRLSGGTLIRESTYQYDGFGRVIEVNGPRTDVADIVRYNYDARGNLASTTDATGLVTRFVDYDDNGRLLRAIDPNGLETSLSYDLLGRVTRSARGEIVTTYAYNLAGLLTNVTSEDGSTVLMTYDLAQRLTRLEDERGAYVEFTLDGNGNRTAERTHDPSGVLRQQLARGFDALDRVQSMTSAAGHTQRWFHDNNGNLTFTLSGAGGVRSATYDERNRPLSSLDGAGVTNYVFDSNDQLTRVTDARGLTTAYDYDSIGNQVRVTSPDAGVTERAFDAAGNVVRIADAQGRLAMNSYDAANRLVATRYAGEPATQFAYDGGAFGRGRLTGMTDASGMTRWSYDVHGRVIRKTQTISGIALALDYGFDESGRLERVTYPSGSSVRFTYSAGRVASIEAAGATLLSALDYHPLTAAPTRWTWGNGQSYARAFDHDGRLSSYPLGARERDVSYDAAKRVAAYVDTDPLRNQNFSYDAADRLTSYTSSSTSETYAYDFVGNRTMRRIGTTTPETLRYAANSNRLASITLGSQVTSLTYDMAGNLLGDGRSAFAYDGRNRLTRASNASGTAVYLLNGLGQRVSKQLSSAPDLAGDANRDARLDATDLRLIALMARGSAAVDLTADCTRDGVVTTADVACVQAKIARPPTTASTATFFMYDDEGRLLGEYGADGSPLQETIYLGDLPVGVLMQQSIYYVHADHVNAPRVLLSAAGTPVWNWEGDPFGATAADEDVDRDGQRVSYNLRFPGQYFDAETGFHYNMARDYDPRVGRYAQADPLGVAAGVNLYSYVHAMPTSRIDQLGLFDWPLFLQGVGQIGSGITQLGFGASSFAIGTAADITLLGAPIGISAQTVGVGLMGLGGYNSMAGASKVEGALRTISCDALWYSGNELIGKQYLDELARYSELERTSVVPMGPAPTWQEFYAQWHDVRGLSALPAPMLNVGTLNPLEKLLLGRNPLQ